MYCPQCGTESHSGQQYCRACGANLKVIGKALTLSEAIARSDRGPLPKIKELVKSLKIENVSDDVTSALERMNKEILKHTSKTTSSPWWRRPKKTPAERREEHIVKGTISLFSGAGLAIFLYYLTAALVLKLSPDVIARIPFEIDPVVHVLWLVGLVPMLSGAGHILAGLLIRSGKGDAIDQIQSSDQMPASIDARSQTAANIADSRLSDTAPVSVTERTTNLLDPS